MQQILLDLIDNPAVITAIAGIAAYLIARLYTSRPAWQKYEGIMISAIKAAEKLIPDDTPNKSAARFDAALTAFVDQWQRVYNQRPSPALMRDVAVNIPIVHDQLEITGTLK